MSFDIFLPLLTYPDPTPSSGLLRAVDLAATLGGRLTVSTHVVDVPPIINPLATAMVDYSGMAAAAEARSKQTAEQLGHEISRLAERFKLPVQTETFRSRLDESRQHLAAAARTHDYSFLAIDPVSRDHLDLAEALLFGSGGPVVLFPAADAATHLQTIVVAWDGGRAAGRAVRDALPMLRLARQVTIATVSEDKPIPAVGVEGLKTFLSHHGIEASVHDVGCGDRTIGEALQDDALKHDAGLLVMGAYGHNRFREFVLGGATRTVLAKLRLPTLMSH